MRSVEIRVLNETNFDRGDKGHHFIEERSGGGNELF